MRPVIASILLLPALAGLAACDKQGDNGSNASLNAPIPSTSNEAAPQNADRDAATSNQSAAGGAPDAAGSLPVAFRGKWTGKGQDCADARSDMLLTVSARELRFYESVGTITGVEGGGPGAVIVTAKYEGEGQSWTQRQKLTLSADGDSLTILNQGVTTTRKRCPASA